MGEPNFFQQIAADVTRALEAQVAEGRLERYHDGIGRVLYRARRDSIPWSALGWDQGEASAALAEHRVIEVPGRPGRWRVVKLWACLAGSEDGALPFRRDHVEIEPYVEPFPPPRPIVASRPWRAMVRVSAAEFGMATAPEPRFSTSFLCR